MGRAHTKTLLQFVTPKERVGNSNIPVKPKIGATNDNPTTDKTSKTQIFKNQNKNEYVRAAKPAGILYK